MQDESAPASSDGSESGTAYSITQRLQILRAERDALQALSTAPSQIAKQTDPASGPDATRQGHTSNAPVIPGRLSSKSRDQYDSRQESADSAKRSSLGRQARDPRVTNRNAGGPSPINQISAASQESPMTAGPKLSHSHLSAKGKSTTPDAASRSARANIADIVKREDDALPSGESSIDRRTPESSIRTGLDPEISQATRRSSGAIWKRLSILNNSDFQPTANMHKAKARRRDHSIMATPRSVKHDGAYEDIDLAIREYLGLSKFSQIATSQIDGHKISFSEVGDPHGSVVFFCLGMGLTRFISVLYDDFATSLRLRIITPERPGIGASERSNDVDENPLRWPDDVRGICDQLGIKKFSIMAHSAGAIYALATALRMPQHIRCRIHLLSPWIPPSQLLLHGNHQDPSPVAPLSYSQRFLRSLPPVFLRAANLNLFQFTSSPAPRTWRNSGVVADMQPSKRMTTGGPDPHSRSTVRPPDIFDQQSAPDDRTYLEGLRFKSEMIGTDAVREDEGGSFRAAYDSKLSEAIWDLATSNGNPSIDLMVCLERSKPIGFRYVDVSRPIVIRHGAKDSRVPVENVQWLGNKMRRCEVRVLQGEGHGLMANAQVMSDVLTELSGEWKDWNCVVSGNESKLRG